MKITLKVAFYLFLLFVSFGLVYSGFNVREVLQAAATGDFSFSQSSAKELTVTIMDDGYVALLSDEEFSSYSVESLIAKCCANIEDKSAFNVILKAESNIPYLQMAEAMTAFKKAGFNQIGLASN